MIRPFISSLGKLTVVTVISLVVSVAIRWIVVTRMSRAFFSDESCASLLYLVHQRLGVMFGLVFEVLDDQALRFVGGQAGNPLQLQPVAFFLAKKELVPLGQRLFPVSVKCASCLSICSLRLSRVSSFSVNRRSSRWRSLRRSRFSRSCWFSFSN